MQLTETAQGISNLTALSPSKFNATKSYMKIRTVNAIDYHLGSLDLVQSVIVEK